MGSGLILLVIVGAWLAVLVPMALRSHEANSSLGTVDKFHDAMRVLSRRDPVSRGDDRADVTAPRPTAVSRVLAPLRAVAAGAAAFRGRRARPVLSLAARRRRVLLILAVGSLVLLLGAVVGPIWLLAPHLLLDGCIAAYVRHLRRHTIRRAERERRERGRANAGQAPATRDGERTRDRRREEAPLPQRDASRNRAVPVRSVATPRRYQVPAHVAGIPDRMPARSLIDPLAPPLPVRRDPRLPVPARGAQGEPWEPVPVPRPIYLSAPRAPRRVLDLTRPGRWVDTAAAERDAAAAERGREVVERRRAANGW